VLFPTHLLAAALLGWWLQRAGSTRVVDETGLWPAVDETGLWPLALVVAGAALPDVIDKPLASLGVVELFHSVGHSALFAVVVLPVALSGRAGRAVAVGWASHLLLDAVHVVINGRPDDALFLGWPLVVPPTPLRIPPGEFFFFYLWSPSFFLELLVWAGAAVVAVRRLHHRRESV
jgi:hypothetical protein